MSAKSRIIQELDTINRSSQALSRLLKHIPEPAKTVSGWDFTGYPVDTLQACLDHLGDEALPGPLRVVHNAITRAITLKSDLDELAATEG